MTSTNCNAKYVMQSLGLSMTCLKIVFRNCVMTFCLLILTDEASSLDFEPGFRNLQSGRLIFTSYEYDPTKTIELESPSLIHTNDMKIRRVVEAPAIDDSSATNKLENVFRNIFKNIFKNGESSFCYFGEVFQRNEQYYQFAISSSDSPVVSIGFGYVWNNIRLKGRTAEFALNSWRNVLMSKNDKDSNIVVEIQSGSVTEVLTSPKNRLYRPVVCLKGKVLITVTVYNGMKMASIPSASDVDLPNAGKKLTPFVDNGETTNLKLSSTANLLGVGIAEIHTLTSTDPETHLMTGYFFDGRKWWMSPSLVDKKNNWGNETKYCYKRTQSTSITLSVWPDRRIRDGFKMTVLTDGRDWESNVFAIYDTSGSYYETPIAVSTCIPRILKTPKDHCSGVETCSEGNECHWPRSDRQNLLPGLCITITCKYVIEAHKRTGLYKPDGGRRIGGEIAMRLIAPSDVGVKRKGIAMIKALLDRAEDFENINPTGQYEFGGRIKSHDIRYRYAPYKKYFNDADVYLQSHKPVCEEKEKFIRVISWPNTVMTTVGFAKYINFFDYIRCTSHYAVIENLVTNALDPKKWSALELYRESQYQRVDPNSALDKFESRDRLRSQWPQWPAALPKGLTRKLYYNDPDAFGGYSDKPQFSSFYNRDYYSAETELFLGLSSCFYKCLEYYYVNNDPVFHVTTFVRERKGNSADKKYYTEVHPLMWYYGLYYYDIDFDVRDVKMTKNKIDVGMTLFDEHNIPSWFVNKNGDDPDMVEASYISLPDLHKRGDHPSNPYLTVDNFAENVVESS